MTATGPGLTKLPSLGSSSLHRQLPIGTDDSQPDRRRASITDPSLHAHSVMSLATTPASSFQLVHGSLGSRGNTLPSLRELSQHSSHPIRAEPGPGEGQATLQLPSQPVEHEHGPSIDPAARRRGSAADLDNILLNSNSPDHRHHPHPRHPPTPEYPFPSTNNPNQLAIEQRNIHPTQPAKFDSSTGPPPSPSFHFHSQTSNSPVSPRSFPSIPSPNHAEFHPGSIVQVTSRRPSSAMRRRGSRVNDLDGGQTEDPCKVRVSGPGANLTGPDHPRGFPIPSGSQWPYPTPHHRYHLHQKPSGPMKRRHSSQSVSESNMPPTVYYGIPADRIGPTDHPWNSSGLHQSQRDALGEYTIATSGHRLDVRRQSETSTVSSSTGTCFDRRPSGESGMCDGPDDNSNLISENPLRHRSWSSSSNLPFSPSHAAVATSIGNYAFPPLPPREQADSRLEYRATPAGIAENDGWNLVKSNSFDDPAAGRRGSGLEEVHELKDRLADTRLLDRLPLHSQPVPEQTDAHPEDMDHMNQGSRLGAGGALCPYSRSPELKISHKLAERKRRKEMRDLFDELREVLPVTDERHSKGSKWETLSRAVDYMQEIRLENERLKAENSHLQNKLSSINGSGVNGIDQDPKKNQYSNHGGHTGFG
ncbi:hypothetical protein, variant [Puccinia striiformis f. sp. tritici PST-78]|uniref:BHLH domain-containing protein n=1 Tax=Puccinia striiformis f. sp. tritici PST-78 TaxID=1165861 RepID=A0A0L0VEF3_9BASI|nr:hypothetical protein, variant [Puccinia striiformis f. sp. tritici PST-78]